MKYWEPSFHQLWQLKQGKKCLKFEMRFFALCGPRKRTCLGILMQEHKFIYRRDVESHQASMTSISWLMSMYLSVLWSNFGILQQIGMNLTFWTVNLILQTEAICIDSKYWQLSQLNFHIFSLRIRIDLSQSSNFQLVLRQAIAGLRYFLLHHQLILTIKQNLTLKNVQLKICFMICIGCRNRVRKCLFMKISADANCFSVQNESALQKSKIIAAFLGKHEKWQIFTKI